MITLYINTVVSDDHIIH